MSHNSTNIVFFTKFYNTFTFKKLYKHDKNLTKTLHDTLQNLTNHKIVQQRINTLQNLDNTLHSSTKLYTTFHNFTILLQNLNNNCTTISQYFAEVYKTLHNFTKLYTHRAQLYRFCKTLHNFSQLYRQKLYNTLQLFHTALNKDTERGFTSRYNTYHILQDFTETSQTKSYTTLQTCTKLFKTQQNSSNCTTLYKALHYFTQLYEAVQDCTQLFL